MTLSLLVLPAPAALAACDIPRPLAHRGGVEIHTENTRRAIASSGNNGITAVEVDVRFTRDGIPVLMHDATVDRTTNGTGKVLALRWSQIALLETVDGQRVPSLRAALRTAREYRVSTVLLHLKKSDPTGANWTALRRAMTRADMRAAAVVMTRYQRVARTAKQKGLRSALFDRKDQDRSGAYLRRYGRMYVVPSKATTAVDVRRWRAAGIATVLGVKSGDRPSRWANAAETGAAHVMTDHPIAYQAWRTVQCLEQEGAPIQGAPSVLRT